MQHRMKKTIQCAVPVALAAVGGAGPAAADDMFLNFNGDIPGESLDVTHKNEIDVLSWSWNMSQIPGSGGGNPIAEVRDIKINKEIDKSTPQLALRLLDGKQLGEANLIVRSAGGKSGVEYLKIKMTNVRVSKLAQGGAEVDLKSAETVALNFDEVCITYTPILTTGGAGTPSTTCWNILANSKP